MRISPLVFYLTPGVIIFGLAGYVATGGKLGSRGSDGTAAGTSVPSSPDMTAAPEPTTPEPTTFATPVVAAQCKTMIYYDQSGALVATPQPVAALILAGTPITGPVSAPPGAVRRDVGGDMECPQSLVDQVQGLFDDSCFSDIKRKKTALANKVDIETVNKRCTDMGEALHPRSRQ